MRTITAKFPSRCHECGKPIDKGDEIRYDPETKWTFHPECAEEGGEEKDDAESLADRLGFKKED